MKKVLVLAVVSAFLTANVFAQDDEGGVQVGAGTLKFSGAVKTGLRMDSDNSNAGTTTKGDVRTKDSAIYLYSDDVGDGRAARVDLNAEYTNGAVGVKIGVRNDLFATNEGNAFGKGSFATIDPADPTNPTKMSATGYAFSVYNGYGWVKLFDKVKVSAGIIDDSTWGTGPLGDTGTDTNYDTGKGVKLDFQLIDGLSFGVYWDGLFDLATSTAYYAGSDPDKSLPVNGTYTLGAFFTNTTIGALYKNDSFAVGIDIKPQLPTLAGADTYGNGLNVLAGVKFTGIKKLLLVADAEFKNLLAEEKANNWIAQSQEFYVKGQYGLNDSLSLGARFHGKNTFAEGATMDTKADYSLFDYEIRAYGNYKINDVITAGVEVEAAFLGLTKKQKAITGDNALGEFEYFYVKPNASFTLSEGLKFVVFDTITSYSPNYRDASNVDKAGKLTGHLTNQLQLDFIYTF